MKMTIRNEKTNGANSKFAIGGVLCFLESFELDEILYLQINI